MAIFEIDPIHLESSNNNIIVGKNAQVTINNTVIQVDEIVAKYTRQLEIRIQEQQEKIVREKQLTDYQLKELREEIYSLQHKINQKEKQVAEILQLYDNKDVSSLSSNYQEALQLFLQGELEKALVLLDNKKLEDTEKQQAENRILRGRLFYLQGDFQQARNEYQKAVSIHTSDENISYLANLYINLREYKKACTYYRKAIKISKDRYSTVKYLTGLSWCYVQLEQYDKAETQIKKAQKLLINSQKGWIELPWA
ncbi:MAG: tetratricopeptide repeat protein, partial [Tannerellaceae bacterium]|nr:tetratricopeptide repeat protein [Tannerellaceae bacterium]